MVTGSGKGALGWFRLSHAVTYFDHPFHSPYEHTLNIDFVNESEGPAARVAVELTEESARELVRCIVTALDAAPIVRPGPDGPLEATSAVAPAERA